ncbi:MAG: HIT domain-containing protein [Candidatus Krumholzibacteria bacterium]|nr:HIT domain-containing protein [Candidatus Krumholzibacteria bacterium]
MIDRVYAPWRSRYFTMEKTDGCLFCEIQKEEDDALVGILKRGSHWFVILNTFPYTNGHVMIVANRHIGGLGDITPEEGAELVEYLALCEKAIEGAYSPDGMNIGVNKGASGGAGILGHIHFHVVPRWTGDTNFMTALAETRVVSEELEGSYKRLKANFE